MTNISAFFIRKRVLTWMIMVALIFFGMVSFQRLGISEFPDVDFPVVNISISRDGSSPQLNEIEIADVVENAISSVQGIKKIESVSRSGSVEVIAEFDLDKDIDVAVQDIQSVLSRIQGALPDDIDPPSIRKTNPEDMPIMWIGVSSKKMNRIDLMGLVKDQIQPQFSTIDGVADIFLGGYVDPNLRVWIDKDKLKKYDLTVTDVTQSILSEHIELPAGLIENPKGELNVRTYGEAQSIDEFLKLPILKRGGSPNFNPILLKDVARVEMGLANDRFRARVMGETAVGLGFRKQRGYNTVAVGDRIKEKLSELSLKYKDQVEMGVNFDSTLFIKDAVHELLFTLFFAAILTSIVCWFFLGSWGATFNVILAIPTAIIGSFIIISALGYTLNTFSLLGLSMAVGIVVDDAIMILENMSRHKSMNKTNLMAAIDGSNEIFFAVVVTTFSLIAIFIPVTYVQGVIGKFLMQFGVTLSVAVFLSMIEALSLTPMRFAQFGNNIGNEEHFSEKIMSRLESFYISILDKVLNQPKKFFFASIIIFISSLFLFRFVPKEFTPYQDVGRIMIMMRAPLGVSIEYMDEKFKQVEKILMEESAIRRYFGFVGGGQTNNGRFFVSLKARNERDIGQKELSDRLREKFQSIQGAKLIVQDNMTRGFGGGRGFPVEFSVQGPEFSELAKITNEFIKKMESSNLMTDIETSYREGLPELQVLPKRDQASLRGVSVTDINKTIQATIGGVKNGRYTTSGYRYDIRVRLDAKDRSDKADVLDLKVRNNRGELVALKDVVELNEQKILQEITREGRQRSITLTANVAKGASQEDALNFVRELSKDLPQGYNLKFSGSAQAFRETFQGLGLAMILGIIVTYMILGSQFNSFIQPVIILMAIPFSLSGALVALNLFQQSLNIYSMIGIFLIMGLVLKNSIMLVDFANAKRIEGLNVFQSLMKACPLRLRPILMTSIATIAGAMPAALSIGPGAESIKPLALTVIGGMLISTLFTLFVVPTFYLLIIKDKKI